MPKPLATWNPARGAWEVPATANLLCEHSDLFSRTWPTSGIQLGGSVYAPPTSAHPTAGSASSASPGPLLAPPDASVFNDGQTLQAWQEGHERERAKDYNGNGGGTPLAMQVQMLPTPQARDTSAHGGSPAYRQSRLDSGRRNLDDAVGAMLLPTPTTGAGGGHGPRSIPRPPADGGLSLIEALLPTPSTMPERPQGRASASGPCLADALAAVHAATPSTSTTREDSAPADAAERALIPSGDVLFPTPRATDGTKGGPNQRGSSGDLMLPSAVQQLLPTPCASETGGERDLEHRIATNRQMELSDVVRLLPTPTAMDSRASGGSTPSAVTLPDAVVRTSLGERTNPRFADGNTPSDG